MSFLIIVGIAFGLAMDAFAVAIATGAALGNVSARQTFRLSFHFGLFQALMPVIGWLAGLSIASPIARYDHWVAFLLLAFIGSRMIFSSFSRGEPCVRPLSWLLTINRRSGRTQGSPLRTKKSGEKMVGIDDPTRGVTLMMLSVATSIDALAVGFSFAMLNVDVWYPSFVIGIVAFAMTATGMRIGGRLGKRFGRRMEVVGGAVLIAIGVKIVIEHLV